MADKALTAVDMRDKKRTANQYLNDSALTVLCLIMKSHVSEGGSSLASDFLVKPLTSDHLEGNPGKIDLKVSQQHSQNMLQ